MRSCDETCDQPAAVFHFSEDPTITTFVPRLFVYHLPAAPFQPYDLSAGYSVATVTVAPLHIKPLGDLLDELLAEGVELRFTPALDRLQQAVAASSLKFSMIRLR